ncbi:MAG: GNAT family N-acetyltransferase [Burkholderiaceae bacterium]|nr:MAG: GNAT family N-acetyltransferase [Burkholderiaceae bacterium]
MSAALPADQASARWHATELGPNDSADVQALFAQVFGTSMPSSLWQWKYGGGRGRAMGTRTTNDGLLLAHYGGTARMLQVAGHTMTCMQAGDVMVAEQARGILSRRSGPYGTAALGFLQRYIATEEGFAFSFGFPNERAARLSEVLGLYERNGRVLQLLWPRLQAAHRRWDCTPFDWADPRTPHHLDALWLRLSRSTEVANCVLPQRDAAWWRHRFGNHPTVIYRCFWVRTRLTRRLLGAVVLRPGEQVGQEWELLDWLATLADTPKVLMAARSLCAGLGGSGMLAWMSETLTQQPQVTPALTDAAVHTACAFGVSVRRLTQPVDVGDPQYWWWLTGGDTDFR